MSPFLSRRFALPPSLGLAVCFLASCGGSPCTLDSNWEVVDQFQLNSGKYAFADAVGISREGTILVSGGARGSDNTMNWVIRKSTDAGSTWATAQSYQHSSGLAAGDSDQAHGIAFDTTGRIYAIADVAAGGSFAQWTTRRSLDGGGSWNSVDALGGTTLAIPSAILASSSGGVFVSGRAGSGSGTWLVRKSSSGDSGTWSNIDELAGVSAANGIAEDTQGRIYAVGSHDAGTGDGTRWTVRRSTNAGTSWETVDEYSLAASNEAVAQGIAVSSNGSVYVVGKAYQNSSSHWLVRRSSTGNAGDWTTVDQFQVAAGRDGIAYRAHVDSAGRIWVAGRAKPASGPDQWVVRMSQDGTTWETKDSYQLESSVESVASSVSADPSGNIYVAGYASSGGSSTHWIVRKLACR